MSSKLNTVTMQLDDDVWAECQRLGKVHGTINEGLRAKLFEAHNPEVPLLEIVSREVRRHIETRKRGPRTKGDKQR